MTLGWFLCPYKPLHRPGKKARYCAMDDHTLEGFRWEEAGYCGRDTAYRDTAIVGVRAHSKTLDSLSLKFKPLSEWELARYTTPKSFTKIAARLPKQSSKELEQLFGLWRGIGFGEGWRLPYSVCLRAARHIGEPTRFWRESIKFAFDERGSFPTTSVLDTGVRANAGPPPSASWTADTGIGTNNLVISSNSIAATTANAYAYWNVSTFGPNSEVFCTITTKADGNYVAVYARVDPAGNNGYEVENDPVAGTDTSAYFIMTGAVFTQLGASVSQEFANGDGLGLEIVGSTLQMQRRSASVWATLGTSRSDSTYASAGNLALQIGNTLPRVNDFGGGTIAGVYLNEDGLQGYILEDDTGMLLLE